MIMYSPYPAYRPSGIEWLGDVPEHWTPIRLKYLCWRFATYGANVSSNNYIQEGIRFLRTTDIDDNGNLLLEESIFVERESVREYLLDDGDILFSRSGTIGRSFVYSRDKHGECAYAGYLVRFSLRKEYLPHLIFYFAKSHSFFDWLGISVIQSTIGNVNAQKYANLYIPIPSFLEQQAIVAYLDRETSWIDSLIAKKRALIDLLNKQRISIISYAVTRGLDPDVPMKPSGVEWLGDVPEHWDIFRLKHLASVQLSNVNKHTVAGQLKVFLCNYVDVYKNERITSDIDFLQATATNDQIRRLAIQKGDVILTKDSETPDDIGVPAIVMEDLQDVVCGYHLALVRTKADVAIGEFVFRFIQGSSTKAYYYTEAPGITRYGLSKQSLANTPIALPPLIEQQKIVDFINQQTEKIDVLVTKIKESIDLLQRQRTAIISAAVTGKIDVRGGEA